MWVIKYYILCTFIPEKKYVCRGDSKLCTKYNRERVRVVVYYTSILKTKYFFLNINLALAIQKIKKKLLLDRICLCQSPDENLENSYILHIGICILV